MLVILSVLGIQFLAKFRSRALYLEQGMIFKILLIQGSTARLTPKIWKQKRRLSKLSKILIQQYFKYLPLFELQSPGFEFCQKADLQHWILYKFCCLKCMFVWLLNLTYILHKKIAISVLFNNLKKLSEAKIRKGTTIYTYTFCNLCIHSLYCFISKKSWYLYVTTHCKKIDNTSLTYST